MIRTSIEQLPASRIREVANAGLACGDVLKFWFGEGDQVTPAFIREAAKASLDAGETFYNHNLGITELRETLADYSPGCTDRPHPSVPIASRSPAPVCMRCLWWTRHWSIRATASSSSHRCGRT